MSVRMSVQILEWTILISCLVQSQLGIVYKIPEDYTIGNSYTFLTGALFAEIDEYEVFYEQ